VPENSPSLSSELRADYSAGMLLFWLAMIFWATAFGTGAGVIWRQRGGRADVGFLIGAFFGVFGLAWCAFATPKSRRPLQERREIRYGLYIPPVARGMDGVWWAAVTVSVAVVGTLVLTAPKP
jgi:hypothetical protein